MSDKLFIIKCTRCHWVKMNNGTSEELKDLFEYKKCANCGGPRKFRCPGCGKICKMNRLRGNKGFRNE